MQREGSNCSYSYTVVGKRNKFDLTKEGLQNKLLNIIYPRNEMVFCQKMSKTSKT